MSPPAVKKEKKKDAGKLKHTEKVKKRNEKKFIRKMIEKKKSR